VEPLNDIPSLNVRKERNAVRAKDDTHGIDDKAIYLSLLTDSSMRDLLRVLYATVVSGTPQTRWCYRRLTLLLRAL
jgi:hypothetical protein